MVQLRQAGMSVSVQKFYIFSAVCGVACALLVMFLGAPLLVVPSAPFLAGMFGLPRWFVGFKRSRRIKAFLNELPNASTCWSAPSARVPLHDGVRLIGQRGAPEPVKTEFRRVVESQNLGMSLPEATLRMQESDAPARRPASSAS